MKVSVVTVGRNAQSTVADAIASVAAQDYDNTEHTIIDGASTDRTVDIIRARATSNVRWISEADDGIYAAMKGDRHGAERSCKLSERRRTILPA